MNGKGVLWMLFILAILILVLAYFKGFRSDAGVSGNILNKLGLTFTGRNQSGQFAAYPTNG